jgi:hypothetical protein
MAAASKSVSLLNRARSQPRCRIFCKALAIVMRGLPPEAAISTASARMTACQSRGGTVKQPIPGTSMPTACAK